MALVIDLFDDPQAVEGPIYEYGFPETGSGLVSEGVVRVTRDPVLKYHGVAMRKTYAADLSPGSWVHFRFRMAEALLGANMYTFVRINEIEVACIGINGAAHWQQEAQRQPKLIDDEFFVTLHLASGTLGDVRLAYPEGLPPGKQYTDWTLFSLKHEIDGLGVRRLRVFVDGREVTYRNIDAVYPEGAFDPVVDFAYSGTDQIQIVMSVMNDGDQYADLRDAKGYRGQHCYAAFTPAEPSLLVSPPDRTKKRWMVDLDVIMEILAAEPDLWNRRARVWDAVYSGDTSLEAAVVTGAIPLPGPDHVQWTYLPAGAFSRMQTLLEDTLTRFNPSVPSTKRWIWTKLYEAPGDAAIAVSHGYLTPEEARNSALWNRLPGAVRAAIPEPARQRPSRMEWDFVCVGEAGSDPKEVAAVRNLIFAGVVPTSVAIFVELIGWADAQFNCPYMDAFEVAAVRAHPLGSPAFCPGRPG